MADETASPFVAEAAAPGLGTGAPPPAAKPARKARPARPPVVPVVAPVVPAAPAPTLADALAMIAAMGEKLDGLRALVVAQTTLLTALAAAPAAGKSAPTGPPVNGVAVVGERNSKYVCPVVGRDGKAHGPVTVNRFRHCPDCYNEAHFQASAKKAA